MTTEPQAEFGPERYAKPRKVGGPRGAWQLLEQVSSMTMVLLLSVSVGLALIAVETDNVIALTVFSVVWLVTLFALMGWLGRRHDEQAAGRHRRPA
ncbi:hypothetical protein OHV05_11070 [Kitasatospora sp. NBC_00070]|uniref:hypothetical protein n=1 Tax=Kitasatospora sp. NBC_00070 TaxID=2975962 RepID=UPI0032463786